MIRMARALLICLLVLALPAQGALAATMVWCGPNHSGSPSTAAAGSDAAHDGGALHHQEVSAGHSVESAADARAERAAAPDSAAPDPASPAGAQSCSVCASCCSAPALHDTAPGLALIEPAAAAFAPLTYAAEPFAVDGLDRPPRRIFA